MMLGFMVGVDVDRPWVGLGAWCGVFVVPAPPRARKSSGDSAASAMAADSTVTVSVRPIRSILH